MSEDNPKKNHEAIIKQLLDLVKKLQEENERLKERLRAFYGH